MPSLGGPFNPAPESIWGPTPPQGGVSFGGNLRDMLAVRALDLVSGVNSFRYASEITISRGDAGDLYFQFIDPSVNRAVNGFNPGGLRHVTTAGSTVAVTFLNVDASKQFTRTASVAFPLDTSIWKVPFLSTDPLDGTISIKVVLTEGGVITTIYAQAILRALSGVGALC